MTKKMYELTSPQKSIWLTEQYYNGTAINNICGILVIKQKLNFELFNLAINKFIENNDSFRLRFKLVDGIPYQYLSEHEFINFEITNIENENQINTFAENTVKIPFDFYNSRLFDFKILKFSNGFGGFIVNVHHIISDAATLSFVGTEIVDIYSKLLDNIEVEQKTFSYIDYINSEKDYMNSNRFKKDQEYWNTLLSPIPEVATIPSFKNESDSPVASRLEFSLDKDLLDKVYAFCKEYNISIYNFLISIYSLYIGRINNIDNFSLGTPILNRTSFAEKHTSGMFISTSLLKIHLPKNINFIEFSQNIARECMSMLRHQKYNYQYILEDLRKENKSVPNLYDIILSYQVTKATDSTSKIPYETSWYGTPFIGNNLNIHFHDNNNTGNILVEYDYKKSKYDEKDIKNIHLRILYMLEQILLDSTIDINNIDIITKKEKNEILNNFNNNVFDYPKDKTIIELFKEQVIKNPDNIALVFGDKKLTYKELDNLSDSLANYLSTLNPKYEDKIAIFLDKSIEMIISILAILKLNCAYVPIDIGYPQDRINYILSDSSSHIILTTEKLNRSEFSNFNVVLLENIDTNKNEFKYAKKSHSSLAYVMYTSGSTGKPKGVMIENKNIVRLVKNPNYIKFDKNERILQTGSIVFDACTFEIWAALLNGFELYILAKEELLNPTFLSEYLSKNQITILWLTAPLFNQLCDINPDIFSSVKYLLTGGDVLSVKHINKAMDANPNLKIINGYGPTENTTFSCCFNIDKKYDSSIPIGYPISGTLCYVVSPSGKLQPVGSPGELWVGGDGVGRGYLNREDLTSEKFINNPFADGMIYKTGDLVKWLPNGTVDFIGRIDNQVKIRGFRVELNEINNTILCYEHVKNSTTIIQTINGNKTICSYIIPKENFNLEKLKMFLQTTLPAYMIPSYFTIMESLPITVNGKIDKNMLPIPEEQKTDKVIVKPSSSTEKKIYSAIEELNINNSISIKDNFFNDIGLDSLNAMQLCAKLYEYNITIQDISNFPTIELLAQKIDTQSDVNLFENHLPHIEIKNDSVNYDLKNVLLTGTIGFLGMHILKELLCSSDVKKIYCLVRSLNGISSNDRFYKSLTYYFGNSLDSLVKDKVVLLDGDFIYSNLRLEEKVYTNLINSITTVIHCGANVKHYGSYQTFNSSNVKGTQNIIDLCKKSGASLAHISTVSIGGFCSVDKPLLLTEYDFNINQQFNNQVYMITKYLAEYNILTAINDGEIKGSIFRLGNIMPRFSDSLFQANAKDNAFISRLKTFIKVKAITEDYMNLKIDLSPVDLCAESILKIMKCNKNQTIYHIFNNNLVSVKQILNNLNIDYNIVSRDEFVESIRNLKNASSVHILNDLHKNNIIETPVNNDLTINLLKSIGFKWNSIDSKYINNLL